MSLSPRISQCTCIQKYPFHTVSVIETNYIWRIFCNKNNKKNTQTAVIIINDAKTYLSTMQAGWLGWVVLWKHILRSDPTHLWRKSDGHPTNSRYSGKTVAGFPICLCKSCSWWCNANTVRSAQRRGIADKKLDYVSEWWSESYLSSDYSVI